MPRRLLQSRAILLLIVGAMTCIVAPASADAANDCDLVVDPFIVREDGFSSFFTGDTVSARDLLDFANGDIDRAVRDAQNIAAIPLLPDDIRTFYEASLVWFAFTAADECADAIAYPGPFENTPATPVTPYGFTLNPAANPATPSFSDAAPATVLAAPTGSTLAHTGNQTNTLLAVSAGLVACGASALGSKRRVDQRSSRGA